MLGNINEAIHFIDCEERTSEQVIKALR